MPSLDLKSTCYGTKDLMVKESSCLMEADCQKLAQCPTPEALVNVFTVMYLCVFGYIVGLDLIGKMVLRKH